MNQATSMDKTAPSAGMDEAMNNPVIPSGMDEASLKRLLDEAAARINSPSFIADDPVQFPRRFSSLQDIEISAMIASMIAWGNRKMICRNADRILSMMADDPAAFCREGAFESFEDSMNLHRTFFGRDLKYFLRGMRAVMRDHGSLQGFAASLGAEKSETPAWVIASGLLEVLRHENNGLSDPRCLPSNMEQTALKRFNMALRWLVRDDGIVDLGVWDLLSPAQLFIPLDVHVGRISRELGLLTRRSNDRKGVLELTGNLRRLNPADPVLYDYALFGIGVENRVGNPIPSVSAPVARIDVPVTRVDVPVTRVDVPVTRVCDCAPLDRAEDQQRPQ